MKTNTNQILDSFEIGEKSGISYIQIDEIIQNTSKVIIGDNTLTNFGNCSYLGLDHLQSVREKIITAIKKYGGLYSSSRAFSSLRFLSQTEEKISQLFGRESILYTTTGIAYLSVIPALISKKDLIVFDRRVHKTIQNAIWMTKGYGINAVSINHNAKEELEEVIINYKSKYNKIYLMMDSIYSMSGMVAPLQYYYSLLEKYDSFYLYADDAHGMSWTGDHGIGLLLSTIPWHEKLIMATSFSKGFGAHGSAVFFPNKKMKNQIKYMGSGTVFSGPLPPPSLASIQACADIHLSNEILSYQKKLSENLDYFNHQCKTHTIPLISTSISPVNFIELGATETTLQLVSRLLLSGMIVNACDFPAVSRNKSGIRITINAMHTKEEIYHLVQLISQQKN